MPRSSLPVKLISPWSPFDSFLFLLTCEPSCHLLHLPTPPDRDDTMQAHKMRVQRTGQPNPLNIDDVTTWSDYKLCQELGISLGTRETVCRLEASDTKDVPSSTLAT